MRKAAWLAMVTVTMSGLTAWAWQAFGPRSVWFAFLAVWMPTGWFALLGDLVRLRLPECVHRLRPVERDGRIYERLGVRIAAYLVRHGPLSVLSRDMRLHGRRDQKSLADMDDQMRRAEAVHLVLFVALLPVVAYAVWRTWWDTAAWILLFNVLVNAYPAMVQRYNRAWLARLVRP